MKLDEEIGRNYHTLDTDPYTWKDHSDIEVNIYATTHKGKWVAQVKSLSYPELSTKEHSFVDEEEANHWARSQAENIKRHTINENALRRYIRNLLTESMVEPSSLGNDFAIYTNFDYDYDTAGFLLYRVSYFEENLKEKLELALNDGDPRLVLHGIRKCLLNSGVAGIQAQKNDMDGNDCNFAWEVQYARAVGGYGPTLYDLVMEASPHGIYPDRMSVSPDARSVWKKYFDKRKDVDYQYLDVTAVTPSKTDDCDGEKYGTPFSPVVMKNLALNFAEETFPEYFDQIDSLHKQGEFKGYRAGENVLFKLAEKIYLDKRKETEYLGDAKDVVLEMWESWFENVDQKRNIPLQGDGKEYLNVSYNLTGRWSNDLTELRQRHEEVMYNINDLIAAKIDISRQNNKRYQENGDGSSSGIYLDQIDTLEEINDELELPTASEIAYDFFTWEEE